MPLTTRKLTNLVSTRARFEASGVDMPLAVLRRGDCVMATTPPRDARLRPLAASQSHVLRLPSGTLNSKTMPVAAEWLTFLCVNSSRACIRRPWLKTIVSRMVPVAA